MNISKTQIRQLRGLAHDLNPVLRIGDKGITEGLLTELDIVLEQHELIKVSIAGADKSERKALTDEVCNISGAVLVQMIGKISIIYRQADKPKLVLL